MAKTKPSKSLTLRDRLSRLNYLQASRLLGPESASQLLSRGGGMDINIDEQVTIDDHHFKLDFGDLSVTIGLSDARQKRLQYSCSCCSETCEHIGAAFSLILEEKMALGLSAVRPETAPLGSLSDAEVIEKAIAERRQRAVEEKMTVRSQNPEHPWSDYTVTNRSSGRAYRVAYRGTEPGISYCSCPDFRKNTLGICKHIIRVENTVKRRFNAGQRSKPYQRSGFSVAVNYGERTTLRLLAPHILSVEAAQIAGPVLNRPIEDIPDLLDRLRRLEGAGQETTVYPDAEEWIQGHLLRDRLQRVADDIRRDPAKHPLRNSLLRTELLPYQLEGIGFAVGAGRSILADDMGLGKTIQGIGVAALLNRQTPIQKVLVICPASLKSQWRIEIERFSDLSCAVVLGSAQDRASAYGGDSFFTICNYEQVLRDVTSIERVPWDLIILDEAQRIKNWETKTSQIIKGLRSTFALVLTGTPLENRLDDLFSIVEFVDDRRLGPAFRFFNRHRVLDEGGRVAGYEGLDELREKLQPIMLRRTRAEVMSQLPPRTNEIVRIPPTDEQLDIHTAHRRIVNQIVRKPYLTEMDILRLQKALLMCRMVADSTFLVNRQPSAYSSKLERLEELLSDLGREDHRKIVLFSEWTTMLDLIEPLLEKNGMRYVRLDGSVPQKKRQGLVNEFQNNSACKLFITTNAGSTGLNLQAANTVINVDLPWNPAVLEQRIGRAHRMGQKSPVHVYLLVTEETIEESLLTTLSAKHQLALAALDVNSGVDFVELSSGIEELKRRLELLLGAKPEAPPDQSQQRQTDVETANLARQERLSIAGGQMLQAAFSFLGEMLPERPDNPQSTQLADQLKQGLSECLEQDEQGRTRLTVTLPDPGVLDTLANNLARLLPAG